MFVTRNLFKCKKNLSDKIEVSKNNSKSFVILSEVKILTENSKTPLSRALALASFLGTEYPPNLGARTAPPAKDLMAFGSVLAHNQHNIGRFTVTILSAIDGCSFIEYFRRR